MKRKMDRERNVVALMVKIYCRSKHKSSGGELCAECRELLEYTHKRLKKCPIDSLKRRSCRVCEIHCYDRQHRERIKEVMRYSGPRMLFYNPIMAIQHLIAERR